MRDKQKKIIRVAYERRSRSGYKGRVKKQGRGGKFTWEGPRSTEILPTASTASSAQDWLSCMDPRDPLYASDDDDTDAAIALRTVTPHRAEALVAPPALQRQRSAPSSIELRWNPVVAFDPALDHSHTAPTLARSPHATVVAAAVPASPSLPQLLPEAVARALELCPALRRLRSHDDAFPISDDHVLCTDRASGNGTRAGSSGSAAEAAGVFALFQKLGGIVSAGATAPTTTDANGCAKPAPRRASLKRQTSAGRLAATDSAWGHLEPALLDALDDGRLEAMEGLARRHSHSEQSKAGAADDGSEEGAGGDKHDKDDKDNGADKDEKSGSGGSGSSGGGAAEGAACAKRIMRELRRDLPRSLDLGPRGAMFLRFDEERMQFMRALITGVSGTPYANGAFLFDLYCPPDYPNTNPRVVHITPAANTVKGRHTPGGFSPNLHSDSGKVCLSLLGTWQGVGWSPGKSNIYQVLSSIQWMILAAEEPYYMEPGYGGWEGTVETILKKSGGKHSNAAVWYRELVEHATMQLAVLAPLRACTSPPLHEAGAGAGAGAGAWADFRDVLRRHFRAKRRAILDDLDAWMSRTRSGEHRHRLAALQPQIKRELAKLMHAQDGLPELRQAQGQVAYVLRALDAMQALRGGEQSQPDEVSSALDTGAAPARNGADWPGVLGSQRARMRRAQLELAEAERTYFDALAARRSKKRACHNGPERSEASETIAAPPAGPALSEDDDEEDDEPFGEAPTNATADY